VGASGDEIGRIRTAVGDQRRVNVGFFIGHLLDGKEVEGARGRWASAAWARFFHRGDDGVNRA
jgi:hypothetical protein